MSIFCKAEATPYEVAYVMKMVVVREEMNERNLRGTPYSVLLVRTICKSSL